VQCNEWEEDCLSVCLFVCLSVCLSPASTLSLHLAEGAAVSNDDDAAVSLLWVETYRIDLSRRYACFVLVCERLVKPSADGDCSGFLALPIKRHIVH